MKTLEQQLFAYFLESRNDWHVKGGLLRMEWKNTKRSGITTLYMSTTVARTLNLMEVDKKIAVKPEGKTVVYKYLPPEYRGYYVCYSDRSDPRKTKLFSRPISEIPIQSPLI